MSVLRHEDGKKAEQPRGVRLNAVESSVTSKFDVLSGAEGAMGQEPGDTLCAGADPPHPRLPPTLHRE